VVVLLAGLHPEFIYLFLIGGVFKIKLKIWIKYLISPGLEIFFFSLWFKK
jgi:hypothetical protein